MGLREDISAAISSISSAVPDAAVVMRHGDAERGSVVLSSAQDLSAEPVSADAPQEVKRIVGRRQDFPTLGKGSTVLLGNEMHLITSARLDAVGATITAGVSAAMNDYVATFRRAGTPIRQPLRVLAVASNVLDPWADAVATTTCRAWFVCVPSSEWTEMGGPQIGDELIFDDDRVKVASVSSHSGYWVLNCRSRR
jgi:hypothetical protein